MVKMNGDSRQSLDSNNDESFVVLERCTDENDSGRPTMGTSFLLAAPSTTVGGCSGTAPSPQTLTNSLVQLPSLDPVGNMNSEGIQLRLQELIKENSDLKATLQQHNLAMKQQFQTLKMWQDQVFNVHQTHKEKFEETKQLITKITAENKELKKLLAEKPKGESNEVNTTLLAENAALQKQVNALQAALNNKEKKYHQPSAREAELNSVVEKLNRQLELAEKARRQLSIDVERLTAQKNSRMHPPLNAPIAMLEDYSTQEKIQPAEQVKRYSEWLLRLKNMEEEITRSSSLASWTPVEPAGDLSLELHELRKLLVQEQKLSASRNEALCEVRQCFQRLLADYQALYHDWEWLKQEEHTAKESHKETVENLKSCLSERESQVELVRARMSKLEADSEEAIHLLKAQVNVYQVDFEAERKSREEAVNARERLAEEYRHLQRRNEQLRQEVKHYQDGENENNTIRRNSPSPAHSPCPPQPIHSSTRPQSDGEERSGGGQYYYCPNPECGRAFDQVLPLEVHVIECLKLAD